MAKLIKCKICGDTEFSEVGELLQCRSCKHKMPKPKENAELLERANNLRFETKSFDEAASLYEEIIRITPDEAEAYWGRVLCRYGIEYVKDSDGRYLPTCHRTLEGSILDDGDYKMAVMKAQRGMSEYYMTEAQTIDEYQKKIKLIAAKEEPYDVFISFKATDEYGRPTPDSLLAQELYYYLTKKLDLKVFFSNITLRDKAGQEYEPIIYAALSSATVMVLVGTKPEYVNATWVKNEWSRYTKMVAAAREKGKSKYIVSALKDMRPEELPSVLAAYQAVNLGELGALEKLCSNIDGLIGDLRVSAQKAAAAPAPAYGASDVLSAEAANLCNLGFQQLELGDFEKAEEYFEKATEKKADTALAHWGLLLAIQEAENDEALAAQQVDIKSHPRYKMAMQYATAEERMRFERIDSLMNAALMKEAEVYCNQGFAALSEGDFEKAEELFDKAIEIKEDMSLANWGLLQACLEVRNDEEMGQLSYFACHGELFDDAMRSANDVERARYLAVVEKNKAAVAVEAEEALEYVDAVLSGEEPGNLKDVATNIIYAIKLMGGDVAAKYYWAWLRLFMGAVSDEGMADKAYPIKDDIFYKRAIERADERERARYERIADRCQRLYDIRQSSGRHYMYLVPESLQLQVYKRGPLSEEEARVAEGGGEVLISKMDRAVTNSEKALDEYMQKYLLDIIPDPYEDNVEGADDFGRYKYLKRDTVSVYLKRSGSRGATIRSTVAEKLGIVSREALDRATTDPCYIGHDIPMATALELLTAINAFGHADSFIHSQPLNDIIAAYEPALPKENERVAVYLTNCTLLNGDIIKYLRKHHNVDKKEAKAVAAGLATSFDDKRVPYCLGQGLPLSEARVLLEDVYENLQKGVAEYRWE